MILLLAVLGAMGVSAQEYTFPQPKKNIADSRNETINMMLDYRFMGGHWNFEKLFFKNFKYPDFAIKNCVSGIAILEIDVNCKGELENVTVKNPLGFGIEQEIKRVLALPGAKWNTCKDDKYTHLSIPILFVVGETQTNRVDPYMTVEGDSPGFTCRGDDYYWERAKKYLEKKKGKRAIQYLDILIKRNPMTTEFIELKKAAIKMM